MSGSSVSFYPMGNMRQAIIELATSEAAGFPKENLMDFNPDTFWRPTGLTSQSLEFDLGTAKQVDAIILWIRNYIAFIGTTSVDRYFDDSGAPHSWTFISGGISLTDITTPIRISEATLGSTHRYWRTVIIQDAIKADISAVWCCRKYTIAQAAQWPEQDIDLYHNRVLMSPGGRQFVQSVNFNTQEVFTRKYRLSLTDMNTLKSVFNDCKGRVFPLILQEGTTFADARLVRFASDSLDENQLDFELFEPTVQFITIPYIPDGELY